MLFLMPFSSDVTGEKHYVLIWHFRKIYTLIYLYSNTVITFIQSLLLLLVYKTTIL